MKTKSILTRRDFLRASAMTAVGVVAASCAQPTPQVIEKPVTVVVEKEVQVEKEVLSTVIVEKEVAVEKVVQQTVIVETEKVVKETVVVQKEVSVDKVITATPVTMKYKEAPMLAGLVQEGKLPPVDERLPENPGVATPFDEIGQYGGTWHRLAASGSDIQTPYRLMGDTLFHWDKDGSVVSPHVAESFDLSADGKTLSFSLRKGMKWSDGMPFTADDLLFYWDEVLGNEDMGRSFPGSMSPGGEPTVLEKMDDYNMRFSFAEPFPLFVLSLATSTPGTHLMLYPKHYLQQFHANYVDAATLDKMTKDAGFEFWYQLFGAKGGSEWGAYRATEVDLPVVHPWRVTVPSPKQPVVLERNPYFWRVDPEGNQLPYIDRIEHMIVSGADVINLRAISGEVDMQLRHITFINYSLYQENKERGDYHFFLWPQGFISDAAIQVNMYHPDPVLREILADKRFRYALSLGMDREEIIEAIYLGVTEPLQVSPLKSSPHYWEEQAKNMIEHDPDRANDYLDEMGLTEKDSEGYRLRPDGKRLTLVFEYAPQFGAWGDMAVLLVAHWKELGIELIVKEEERTLWETRADLIDITVWTTGGEFNPVLFNQYFRGTTGAGLWTDWWNSDGAEGVEPPDWFKRQFELSELMQVTVDEGERAKMMRETLEIAKEQMPVIGTCTAPPQIVVVKNGFRNVPESAVSDWNLLTPANAFPDQFYIQQ